jgi:hypothetical protein
VADLIGLGEIPTGACRLIVGGFPFAGAAGSSETAKVLDFGQEAARFIEADCRAAQCWSHRGYRPGDRYRVHYLHSREDGALAVTTYREKEGVLETVPLRAIGQPSLGSAAPYLDRVISVIAGYDCGPDLEFLRHLPKTVSFRSVSASLVQIDGLRHLQRLRELNLGHPTYRLDVLGELSELESLYLDGWQPGAQSLFGLRNLVRVGMQRYAHEDLSPTAGWSQLRYLWLNAGRLRFLGGIPSGVRHLKLTNQRKLLEGISGCIGLRELTLDCCAGPHSLEGVQHCRRLGGISLRKSGLLLDLSPLGGLEDLEELSLIEGVVTEETSLEGIYGHPRLRDLCIPREAKLDVDRLLADSPNCQIRLATN